MKKHHIRKAVFPVAGLGTRFLPATRAMPKEMLILGDRPLIEHAVAEAREAGIEEFIFVSAPEKKLLEDHFRANPPLERLLESRGRHDAVAQLKAGTLGPDKLRVTYQDQPLGLGHAVWCAREFVGDEPFAVILPDDVVLGARGCMGQMVDAWNDAGGNMVAVENVPKADTAKYGVIDPGAEQGRMVAIRGLVEKPAPEAAPSTLAVIGRYILQPSLFAHLALFEKGAGGEIQLTDAMAKLIGGAPFNGFRFEGRRFDCGSRSGLFKANIALALQDGAVSGEAEAFLAGELAALREAVLPKVA
ncbi:MAG TPA: UTP--glucose-1-phosphate uridylyltransferase [Patescibacteria group bacterium]|nr:UTP--glucose-1-phosphate uridylyltransferase [Patescibacteria group bacterium]